MDSETYLSERLEPQLDWLSKASRTNKKAYLRYRMLGIVLGAGITILSPYSDKNVKWNGIALVPLVLQLCGAGVALSGALLALNQHQENWLRYRSLKEALEREKWLYITGSSAPYSGSDSFRRFVCNAEAMMGEERSIWLNQSSDAEAKAESNEASLEEKNASPVLASPRSASPAMESPRLESPTLESPALESPALASPTATVPQPT
jgi:hypothetical protein